MSPPIRFFERPNSRSGTTTPPTLTQNWRCTGTNDATYVRALAQSVTSTSVVVDEGILYRQDVKVDSAGHMIWDITVPYGQKDKSLFSASISFDTTGGTFHVTTAKEHINTYVQAGFATRNHGGLIGVKDNKTVEGADIVIPASKRTVSIRHAVGHMSSSQIDYLEDITGMVNSTPFMGRPAGEVLFLGAKGKQGTDVETECSYDLAMSKNLASAIIGGITGVNKDGWDLFWTEHAPALDSGNPVRRPMAIHIERVYDRINLGAALGFGG